MKQNVKNLLKHPLIYSSGIMILGTLGANFFNFLFNVYMTRTLSDADYGILASIMSIIAIPGLATSAILPLIVQFAGTYFAEGKLAMVRGLYQKVTKFFLAISIAIFILFQFFIPQINNFFQITDPKLLFIANIIIFFTLMSVINNTFLQAKLSFKLLMLIGFLSASIKLIAGIFLVNTHFGVLGASIGILLATAIPYGITFLPMKFIFDKKMKSPHISTKSLFAYGIPSAMTLLGLTSLISTDIILVKHFFNPQNAGIYAKISLIARIIFFLSAPIANVMFPIIVQKYSKKEKYTDTFILAVILVLVPSICLTIFYSLFPKFTILFFFKNAQYLKISSTLVYFAIFITAYSLLSLLCNFYLSIKKTNIAIPIVIGAITQAVLICLIHQNFTQIIIISLTITLLLIVYLLLYYVYIKRPPAYELKK